MVEIALAMAIIAIGLSSILVLFPVGINASKAATANNNLTDVAEYMISYIRANCASEWRKAVENNSTSYLNPTLPTEYPDDEIIAPDDLSEDSNWKAIRTSSSGNNSRLYYYNSPGDGIFLFRQVSVFTEGTTTVEIPEFSAIIKVWRDNLTFNYPKSGADAPPELGTTEKPVSEDFLSMTIKPTNSAPVNQLLAHALCLELSWPAEVPEENREIRTFRFEIFNESFKLEQLP